jgi:hypothetical protein
MIRTAQLPPKGGATDLTNLLEKSLSALLT